MSQAIIDNVSFTLGTEDNQKIRASLEIATMAKQQIQEPAHIQLLAEAHLDAFKAGARYRYARGCSGFAGFTPGSISFDQLIEVSTRMAALIGSKWSAWGTEQFTSNLIICRSLGARLLPRPSYCNPGWKTSDTVLLHFIGYVRYSSGLYANVARRVSRGLNIIFVKWFDERCRLRQQLKQL